MDVILSILLFGLLAMGVVGAVLLVARRFVYVCGPHEIIVFSGRPRKLADGSEVGYRILQGGWALRIPILERAERMDLRNIPIEIRITNAYSKGGIPLDVHAIANVKISDDPQRMGNAIERFLGRDPREIRQVAKETLEGHLRGVLANLTPEEVNEDRLKFATTLVDEAEDDFRRLGLQLDTLKIQSVSDEVNYLASIGRERIAMVLRDAEVAEAQCTSNAETGEAEQKRRAEVRAQECEAIILQANNKVKKIEAELEAQARAEEERTEQAAHQARAEAEQKLQELRQTLETLRLQADVVIPAEADRRARELLAQGQAAEIQAQGEALAEALKLLTQVWIDAGKDARDIFLIQNLESILGTIVARLQEFQVGEVAVLDGGDGQGLAAWSAALPASVNRVLEEFGRTTGVDVLDAIAPRRQPATTESGS